jgi:hypothetical protein
MNLCETGFGDRLQALMNERGIKTAIGLATNLYDSGLLTPKLRLDDKEVFTPQEERDRKIHAIEVKVQKDVKAANISAVSPKYIVAYCQYFNCCPDYLYGCISNKTHDLNFVSDFIGLSGKAVETLQNLNDDERVVINDIVECGGVTSLTKAISAYFNQLGQTVKLGNKPMSDETKDALFTTMCSNYLIKLYNQWTHLCKNIVNHFFRLNNVATLKDVLTNEKILQAEIDKVMSTDYYCELTKK